MTKYTNNLIEIKEGFVRKGSVIGNPTSPRPNIVVQGMGGSQSLTTQGNTGSNGSSSGQENQNAGNPKG